MIRRLFLLAALALITTTLGLDRKSTRLNSSHRTILYAAFCLKKQIARRHPLYRAPGVQRDRDLHEGRAERRFRPDFLYHRAIRSPRARQSGLADRSILRDGRA